MRTIELLRQTIGQVVAIANSLARVFGVLLFMTSVAERICRQIRLVKRPHQPASYPGKQRRRDEAPLGQMVGKASQTIDCAAQLAEYPRRIERRSGLLQFTVERHTHTAPTLVACFNPITVKCDVHINTAPGGVSSYHQFLPLIVEGTVKLDALWNTEPACRNNPAVLDFVDAESLINSISRVKK